MNFTIMCHFRLSSLTMDARIDEQATLSVPLPNSDEEVTRNAKKDYKISYSPPYLLKLIH